MNKFETRPPIAFEYKQEKDKYYSLKYKLVYNYNGEEIVANPVDDDGTFMFNLASVPYYLRWIYKPNQKETLYPSIIHDYLYGKKKTSRLKDDLIFLAATKSEQNLYLAKRSGADKYFHKAKYFLIRWILFGLVRTFGFANKAK